MTKNKLLADLISVGWGSLPMKSTGRCPESGRSDVVLVLLFFFCPDFPFFWFFISEIRLSFFLVWLLNFFLVQTFLFCCCLFLRLSLSFGCLFLAQTFWFFSCPEFPFFWCLYFLDFPFFGCLFLAQTFLFFFLPRVSLFFLVICFLEFLLFVVVYFLPRLSDFLTQTFMFKEADERPSPFFCCFFLDLSFQSKLMSGRLFAAPKRHPSRGRPQGQAQSVVQVRPCPRRTECLNHVAPWHAGRWRQTAAPPGRMRCVRAARGAHVARERLREVQGRWALQLPRRSRNNN